MVRTLRRAALSLSLLTALSLLVQHARAQKPFARDFIMQVSGMNGRDQEKIVHAAINDQDPTALVSIDTPTQQVKIRTIGILDRSALEGAFAPYGVSIISLGPIAVPLLVERVSAASELPGFPQFVNTGDPGNDEAVYQSNKAAWIEAHPDLYPPPSGSEVTAPR